jgi:glycosyltransferase involved in cell wall biosynthesis
MAKINFKDITLLITHYNRSKSLERLLHAFEELDCYFDDILVSDDCSSFEHLTHLRKLQNQFPFRLITAEKNMGLGNNINKGHDSVLTNLILYVQEDFVPTKEFSVNFQKGLEIFQNNKDLDIVRFYAYFKYPYLKDISSGYSEMKFKIWYPGYRKFYMYSDHPHLVRNDFLKKFGRFTELVNPDVGEYNMMLSFLQKKGKGLFFNNFQDLFLQINTSSEPSTIKRTKLRESKILIIILVKHLYRHIKFNFNYLFKKF